MTTSWQCSGSVRRWRDSARGSMYLASTSGQGKGNGSCIVVVSGGLGRGDAREGWRSRVGSLELGGRELEWVEMGGDEELLQLPTSGGMPLL